MNKGVTLAVVGAGSSYTPELVEGILAENPTDLPIRALQLTDLDEHRLGVMKGLTERMVRHAQRDIVVRADVRLPAMLEGVDFVVTQIRVGGMKARYLDESIPLKYGIAGQETTGPGGMFKALRTIPAMLKIASQVERHAPKSTILNYTNPSGIITEAVTRHSHARIIGLCSGLPHLGEWLRKELAEPYPVLTLRAVGLNHFGFYHRLLAQGEDVTLPAIRWLAEKFGAVPEPDKALLGWLKLSEALGAIPIRGYSEMYFNRARRVREMKAQERTRAQNIEPIEKEVFQEAANPDTVAKPKALKQRGGEGYSRVTFSVMRAILHDRGDEIVTSTPNRGTVEGIPREAAVEVVCRIDRTGAHPLPVGAIPLAFRGLVQALKAYESLTVEAAVTRSRRLAIQALLNHPLVGDLDIAEPLVDEMLKAHHLDFS